MTVLIDTHCHLDLLPVPDLSQTLADAARAGVVGFINPAVNIESAERILALAQENAHIHPAAGVHPNDETAQPGPALEAQLTRLAAEKRLVAIGEIGLDYYRQRTDPNIQACLLKLQLEIAREYHLPVILHSREALPDLLAILQEFYRPGRTPEPVNRGVLHAFEGDVEQAQLAIRLGFLIGIGGQVTYRNATRKCEIVRAIPFEWIVLETDTPYLTPEPKRGRPNSPAYLPLVAERVAELRQMDIKLVESQTTRNAQTLFRIGEPIASP